MDTLPHALLVDAWFCILALIAACYVVSDGFDLGIGVLSLFAPDRPTREVMLDAIVHMRDANETWLVVLGGGLFGAFPAAYALLLPQMIVPVIALIAGLILRGAAIELRHAADSPMTLATFSAGPALRRVGWRYLRDYTRWPRATWDRLLGAGSLVAVLAQGVILGRVLTGLRPGVWQGLLVLAAVIGVTAGYALLGATYLLGRRVEAIDYPARRWTLRALLLAMPSALLLAGVLLWQRWEEMEGLPLLPLGLGAIALALAAYLVRLIALLMHAAQTGHTCSRRTPFGVAVLLFVVSLAGVAASVFPYIVPGQLTLAEAASDDRVLALMLAGVAVLLPIMVGYSLYQNRAIHAARKTA